MRANAHEIDLLLRSGGGVLTRREHPQLADALAYLVRTGRLLTLLPGVYAAADVATLPLTRIRAAAAADPDAVLTGTAAAHLTFAADSALDEITVAVRRRRACQPGYVFSRREIPPELILRRRGLACTAPALSALDLCLSRGTEVIDQVLRSRQATLSQLHEALRQTPGRRGNRQRQLMLLESRNNPWSPAEREAHRILYGAGLHGWVGNFPVALHGVVYYLDIAFPEAKLAIEIDGRAYHSDSGAFERDRWRQNDLVLAGWRVLRFTAEMLNTQPHVVLAVIRKALQ